MVERKAYIGSTFVGTQVRTGLDKEEINKILPDIINFSPDEKEFKREVESFFATLRFDVPYAGLELDITMKPDGSPVVPMDYIKYRYAKAHKYVAANKKEFEENVHKTFYIDDPKETADIINKEIEWKAKADVAFAAILTDEIKLDWVIRMLSDTVDPEKLDLKKKQNTVYQLKNNEPSKFYTIITDVKLEKKAEILTMVSKGIIKKDGNMFIYIDQVLGQGIDTVIAFLSDPVNSGIYVQMKAKLEEATKEYRSRIEKKEPAKA